METIHVKFDELTVMASEHESLEPVSQRFINDDSSAEAMNTPSKEDLDNLFGPMYEEYFEKRSSEMSINSAAQQVNNHEDSPSTSLIIVEEHEAHPITKSHPLEQVIGDPSKPVMTQNRLQTDSELCMYALTVSTLEPKNIKEAMSDHIWIESMQDELHQFERPDVWQLVPRPDGKNIIPGYKHEEGIDFEESFALVARLEAFRIKKNANKAQADVHQDELCPPNKRYALMDANKKIDLNNLLCPNERKILANILKNHPLRFSIAASSSVPWIYLGKFWHTLKEDRSKYRLKSVLDRKELTMTLDAFRSIFQLPQATNNNHERFVAAPKFLEMVPFYINNLGFTLELR
ncbi:retrovirus-related pol polyprotein from transposon TNT 1-94 [Tanacetum coccineum]